MEKRTSPIIDRLSSSIILYKIANGKTYNEVLARELKIKPASVWEQLERLKENNFIKEKIIEEDKKYNKKIYEISWNKINEQFFFFLTEMYSWANGMPQPEFLELSKKDIVNCSFLTKMFQNAFKNMELVIEEDTFNLTIRDLFKELSKEILEQDDKLIKKYINSKEELLFFANIFRVIHAPSHNGIISSLFTEDFTNIGGNARKK